MLLRTSVTSEGGSCSSLFPRGVGIAFSCLLLASVFHRGTTWNALMRDALITGDPAFYGVQSPSGTWAASSDDGKECFYFGRRDTCVAKRQTMATLLDTHPPAPTVNSYARSRLPKQNASLPLLKQETVLVNEMLTLMPSGGTEYLLHLFLFPMAKV